MYHYYLHTCRGYQQQDAHEFMRYLLDRLHTELQGTLWPGNPRRQTNGTSTIVTFMFGGLLLSQVHCVVCESFYKKIDPFLGESMNYFKLFCFFSCYGKVCGNTM